jgi:phage-related minor tail protein
MQALYDTIGFLKTDLNPTAVLDVREMADESAVTARAVDAALAELLEELMRYQAIVRETTPQGVERDPPS